MGTWVCSLEILNKAQGLLAPSDSGVVRVRLAIISPGAETGECREAAVRPQVHCRLGGN